MFVDEAEIYVRGGDGGHGCLSFRREKYIPRGGPDGGDGGHGGSVHIKSVFGIDTLMELSGRHHWRAQNGSPGQGKDRTGKSGEDLWIQTPAGSLIYDNETGILLKDLATPDQSICVARGGRAGRGNAVFASPQNQAPRRTEQGQPGQERSLRIELRLLADVGIIGLPNAGKSTLLSRISAARPKIASYPFTTLTPQLGIVDLSDFRRFVAVDVPGLIEGAHSGAGLGDKFLRHIQRTRVVLHLVDVQPSDGDPIDHYRTIRRELSEFSAELAGKPEIVVASKSDLTGSASVVESFREKLGKEVLGISAVTGEGLQPVLERLWDMIRVARQEAESSLGASVE
jgi:GTP-binding protein